AWDYLAQAQPLLPANHVWQIELRQSIDEVVQTLADPVKSNANGTVGKLKGRLENAQSEYIKNYMDLHIAGRLDRAQDERKHQLTIDPRWARMRALSKLNLLPTNQLDALQKKLNETLSCPGLQTSEMKTHTSCPHCGFNPVAEMNLETAENRFNTLWTDFDALCSQWIEVLLKNLATDEAVGNMKYLATLEREAVDEFLRTRLLPNKITESFLTGIENALVGLEMLAIDGTELLFKITSPGMPCTPDELETRIREYLQSQLQGKDRRKLRIQINW
ncbi:MAG: hypothetical protein IMZ61_05455, partial [Planctomycetes bacterium]|nr:hypothetical protein [Planctomycetota bacterium]